MQENLSQREYIRKKVEGIFSDAGFIGNLGIELTHFEEGLCEARLTNQQNLHQQAGFVHAGVLATLADHCSGAAAATLAEPEEEVLTVEFKLNLLRPATASEFHCTARVLKPGRRFSIVEAEVFGLTQKQELDKMVAKLTATIAIVAT